MGILDASATLHIGSQGNGNINKNIITIIESNSHKDDLCNLNHKSS